MDLAFFEKNQWRVVDVLHTPQRAAVLETADDLNLSGQARAYLAKHYPAGIYRHQKIALRASLANEQVCLATGTASGKSLVFQMAALDILERDPQARVMAIYPMKALGNEQRERWDRAFLQTQEAGLILGGRISSAAGGGVHLGLEGELVLQRDRAGRGRPRPASRRGVRPIARHGYISRRFRGYRGDSP